MDSRSGRPYGDAVSTPPDPRHPDPSGGQPYNGPYGTGYGGAVYPHPGGESGAPLPGYGAGGPSQPGPSQQPPPAGQQGGGHPYDPYGGRYGDPQPQYNPYGQYSPPSPYGDYPAGGAPVPVSRPGIMILSLVLLVLSTLPFLLFGVLYLLVPLDSTVITPDLLATPQLAELNITADGVIAVIRTLSVVFLVIALIYLALAIVAFTGRNWARILVTVMTIGFTILMVLGLLAGGAGDSLSMLFILALLAVSVGGTVILFLPPSNRYFAGPRR